MQQRAERDNAYVSYDEYEGRVWWSARRWRQKGNASAAAKRIPHPITAIATGS